MKNGHLTCSFDDLNVSGNCEIEERKSLKRLGWDEISELSAQNNLANCAEQSVLEDISQF